MRQRILQLRKRIKEEKPLIHCITNPISIHDCANVVLAVGARPIMAEHPAEVTDITASAGALMLNLGNIYRCQDRVNEAFYENSDGK
ncbi:MAG: hydroxyethylthiazole kinase [Blautia massiliensis (ex Durand et al. 2017)]|uniref:hydroxyethylthiazole kinase n=1 Tax=Blautia massiliensis (ex Durand et al. 2017) TaxID=1737424 RepID=UPI003990440A